jgi:hypothetical protein
VKNYIRAMCGTQPAIGGEGARISGKVFLWPELRRIYKNAHDYEAGLSGEFSGPIDECRVTCVQRAHRRDENDRCGSRADEAADLGNGADVLQTALGISQSAGKASERRDGGAVNRRQGASWEKMSASEARLML